MRNILLKRIAPKICLAFICCFYVVFLQAQTWKIKQANVHFRIKNAGIYVEGSFAKYGVNSMKFDTLHLEQSFIDIFVEVASINTENKTRDKHLLAEDFFDAQQHPIIQIKSQRIAKKQNQEYVGFFEVKIKGIVQTMEIPFTFQRTGNSATWEAKWQLDRTKFNVGNQNMIAKITMSNIVEVHVKLIGES
ncbi:MAG: YceI family protein [Cytophagales bacterium]|nr:YceI family protein [Cytophagales bacterium]MDW8384913.1 YceI family protein [Flammeovirgaceae bacterium]